MKIRNLEAKDLPLLRALLRAQKHFHPRQIQVAAELIEMALEPPEPVDYRVRCLETSGGCLRGYICYGKAPLTDSVYDLYWIVVHPSVWHQGMGSALLRHAEDDLRTLQARLVLIETSSGEAYEMARSFYQRHGYTLKAQIDDYYARGEHKLIYGKALI